MNYAVRDMSSRFFIVDLSRVPANSEALQILVDRNLLSDSLDAMKRFSPQAIIDLILSSGDQAQELMRVARELHTRVVAISSMDVYRAWGILQAVEPGHLEPLPITRQFDYGAEDAALANVL